MKRLVMALLVLCGCGPQTGTRLEPLASRTAVVGDELVVTLHAADPAAHLQLSYDSDLVDLKTRKLRPTLTAFAGGEAVFRWTPLADDVGAHTIQFNATIDGAASSVRMDVEVIGGDDALAFREPVGEGTTLDTTRTPCADVALLVDDPGSAAVELSQGAVWSEGGVLTQDDALSGQLKFCPTLAQAQAGTIYPFSIVATDEGGRRAEKRYTIVLGQLAVTPPPTPTTPPPECDDVAPVIAHQPHANITTAGNLHLYADVGDADGVYGVTVFWSTDAPADLVDPDLTQMNALDLVLVSGDAVQGSYAATLPNPVYADPPGTTATIYYLLAASDADDRVAGCPYHVTFAPDTGLYSFVVKRSTAP
ncbi:MAG TPA: hypothetical protein VII38_09375 [Polyangia bacterium]